MSKHPYDLKVPCNNCPFRKEGGIRLSGRGRVMEIAETDGEFPCHKTTKPEDSEEGDILVQVPSSKVCAGFMILREKIKHPNQMMRIAERLHLYNYKDLMENNPAVSDVFDSVEEMVEANKER